ncbi:DUF1120 domain-containing protein [Chromobacterium sp. IRSSSOUMB001]|uniref:DUF1120 domain-containing protein n=1 Tax=Chromobacterium sp. IRSSSOUMB001 TaxID=2927123 RepID=UPI0020C0354E|nr:DUF1120 domain-containing protein [Chromobacterium sp. IRSSSOUMB001]
MKFVSSFVVVSSVFCGAFAQAEEKKELQATSLFEVVGKIKPTACNVVLPGGNVWDYGTIPASDIKNAKGDFYKRVGVTHNFQIVCDQAASVRYRLMDQRDAANDSTRFSLVLDSSGEGIGFHTMNYMDFKVKGSDGKEVAGAVLGDSVDQVSWKKTGQDWYQRASRFYTAVGAEGSPVNFNVLEQRFTSVIQLDKKLDVKSEESFRGGVLVELYY